MKQFSLWLVLFGLLLSLLAGCGRGAGERIPKLPEDKTVTLYICEEDQYSQKHLFTEEEVKALNEALSQVSAWPVDDWTVPRKPWPVYGLYVFDSMELDVACFGNLWVDNQGRAFRVEGLNMRALMYSFPEGWEWEDGCVLPCRRTLALRGGGWNERLLAPSDVTSLCTDVSMTLDDPSNGLSWTLANLSQYEFSHGNGGHAYLEVCLEDRWYDVPSQFSRVVTFEGHILPPGKSYSSIFSLEPYGDLPAGNYRITFPLTRKEDAQRTKGYSAACFSIREDGTFAQHSLD